MADAPVYSSQPADPPVVLTADDQAKLDMMYEQLKKEALVVARDYILARLPSLFQTAGLEKVDADYPLPEEEPSA